MTKEDRELLLKDLCGRLPYGVKVNTVYSNENASSFRQRVCVEGDNELNTDIIWLYQHSEIDIKPYLFPLSSMTKEQEREFIGTCTLLSYCTFGWTDKSFDWLNRNHFDFRDLIPAGLATNATGLDIY